MKDDKFYLLHIRDAINAIEKFTKDATKNRFLEDEMMQSAVIRQIQIIGEATKNLSRDLRSKYKTVHWKEIAGMRDILIHAYFETDLTAVWKTVEKDIPELRFELLKILLEFD